MTHLKRMIFALAGLCAAIALPAHAKDPVPAAPEGASPAKKFLEANGIALTPLPREHDIEGYLGVKQGQPQFFYLLPDGKGILIGVLYDNTGKDVSSEQLRTAVSDGRTFALLSNSGAFGGAQQAAAPQATAVPAQPAADPAIAKAVASIADTTFIELGKSSAPVVYMVVDPNSASSLETWNALQPALQSGGVKIRLVLSAALNNGASLPHVAAIMKAPDRAKAWQEHANKVLSGMGGIEPAASVSQDVVEAVRKNHAWIAESGVQVMPAFFWTDKAGQPRRQFGPPPSMIDILSSLR